MRAARGRRRRSSAARLGDERRHAGKVSSPILTPTPTPLAGSGRKLWLSSPSKEEDQGGGHLRFAAYLPDPRRVRHRARADDELTLHENDRAREPHDFTMRFDEFVKPHRVDELHIQFDGGMRLVARGAQCGHAHGLIGERGEHAAVHDVGEVQMLALDEEAKPGIAISPDRTDQFAKADRLDDFPPRAASRRLRSGMSFSALAPSATARPLSPSLRTAST